MNDGSDFYTMDEANSGKYVPLFSPDGLSTDHWVKIRGVDSDAYQRACYRAQHLMIEFRAELEEKTLKSEERLERIIEKEIELERAKVAALVIEWSFDISIEECAITGFFKKAPQIAENIDHIARRRALFFGAGLSGSLDSLKQNSDSTSSKKEVTQALDSTSSKSGDQPE